MANLENSAAISTRLTPAERGVTQTIELGWGAVGGTDAWKAMRFFPTGSTANGVGGPVIPPVAPAEEVRGSHFMHRSDVAPVAPLLPADARRVWGGRIRRAELQAPSGIRRNTSDPEAEEAKRVFQETQREIMREMSGSGIPNTGTELSRDTRGE